MIGIGGNARRDGDDEYARFVTGTGVDIITHVYDPTGEVWRSYGIAGQPAWAFVNDDGSYTTAVKSLGVDGILEAAAELAKN